MSCAKADDHDGQICPLPANKVCGRCRLVAYCSKECQVQSWTKHKQICNSELAKENWAPDWIREDRPPQGFEALVTSVLPEGQTLTPLWASAPAIDLLKLEQNEGSSCQSDLAVLFAGSSDIHSVLKTIAEVPINFNRTISVAVNEEQEEHQTNNIILLLLLNIPTAGAREAIVHIWYSAWLTARHMSLLADHVEPLVRGVVHKLAGKSTGHSFSETFPLGQGTLTVTLKKRQWMYLVSKVSRRPRPAACKRSRNLVVRARPDFWYSLLFYIRRNLHQRLAHERFRDQGVLLPYAQSDLSEYSFPNPTLFDGDGTWLVDDRSSPIDGWSIADHQRYASQHQPPALENDIYGRLCSMVYHIVEDVQQNLQRRQHHVTAICVGPVEMPYALGHHKFDRIDTANMIDVQRGGLEPILNIFKPFLNSSNPHAILVTCLMKTLDFFVTEEQKKAARQKAMAYMAMAPPATKQDLSRISFILLAVGGSALPFEDIFQVYLAQMGVNAVARRQHLAMKTLNTVMEPWPYKVRKQPEDPGATEEFLNIIANGMVGRERFIEWQIDPLAKHSGQEK